ncbi:MAG: 2-oxoacid:acceptor oxidoreductase subunit alpha [Candidatus Limnocylindrales bacterium]|jgi:2-oxoglutarate ferredoxin oxidoreductase subunit alpha
MTKRLVQGNEAMLLGAVRAGATYFAGYPISPSSEILAQASVYASKHPEFRFLQAEDEIASANAILGASLAGAKSFTATSGPGFSLMQEAIGYGHKVGIPTVIVDVMRVGPATGMPTMPGQGDLNQARYGSTGDYTSFAFYPSTVAECYEYTIHSFNAAEESCSPVIILSDAFLGHLNEVADLDSIDVPVVPRTIEPLASGSTRLFSGVATYPDGEPATADADEFIRQYYEARDQRLKVAERYAFYEYGWNKEAETLVIAFGITRRIAQPLAAHFALFRPIRIWPTLDKELTEIAARYKKIIVIEGSDGQYANVVERMLLRRVERVPLLGGRMSIEAIREGLDAIDMLPAESPKSAKSASASPAKVG